MLKIRELVAHVLLLLLMAFMKPPWQKLEQSLMAWICLNSIWLTVVTMEGDTRKLNNSWVVGARKVVGNTNRF